MACILGAEKPKIDYPLFWEYKVVLDATTQKREQIDEILKGENYKIDFSRFSNGGKYMSFNASVFVNSDTHRNEIFERLRAHFKYIL